MWQRATGRLTMLVILCGVSGSGRAQVVISEVAASSSDRLTQVDGEGRRRLGCTPGWQDLEYDAAHWSSAAGPLGMGYAVGTNLQGALVNKAMSVYMRRTFSVAASTASSSSPLELTVDFADGFVAYLNGVEVARRNTGPAGAFVHRDQNAYNTRPAGTPEVIMLGPASGLLRTGTNLLAIQVHNDTLADSRLLMKADLRVGGAAPLPLVTNNTTWQFFVGTVEPSGGVYDLAVLQNGGGAPSTVWAGLSYDDTAWAEAAGPLGFDAAGVYPVPATVAGVWQTEVRNRAASVHVRREFVISASQYAVLSAATLRVDWDDGVVVFLNGQEITRRNLPGAAGSPVPFNTLASPSRDASPKGGQAVTFSINRGQLQPGVNVLAAQLHNSALSDSDLFLDLRLDAIESAGGTRPLVVASDVWKYHVGIAEPPPTLDAGAELPEVEFVDWIELWNSGTLSWTLTGWTLSDDPREPARWTFPNVTIPAGGRLVVAADGKDVRFPPPGGLLHTNFRLSAQGEPLALYSPSGQKMSEVTHPGGAGFPRLTPFHTWGLDPASGQYRYLQRGTPGGPNAAAAARTEAAPVEFSHETGFYTGGMSLTLSCATPGATIRYTTDGSVPGAGSGILYQGPFDPVPPFGGLQPGQPGGLLREVWQNVTGGTVSSIPVNSPPGGWEVVPSAEAPTSWGDNYGQRLRGHLTAPASGEFTFWIAADDAAEFWLGTDENASSRQRRCHTATWTGSREWNKYPANQKSLPITLVAGRRYYVEILHKEATGGDNLAVGWARPGESTANPSEVIPGAHLTAHPAPAGVPPLSSSRWACITARAFAPDALPSEASSRSYLVNYDSRLQTLPAIILSGDARQTLYLPHGVTSIQGGYFTDVNSTATVDLQWRPIPYDNGTPITNYPEYWRDLSFNYNIPMQTGGRPFERPAQLEMVAPGNRLSFRTPFGLRLSGSPHARPHYRMTNLEFSSWNTSWDSKPSFNFFFRSDYSGSDRLRHDVIPLSPVKEWPDFRCRAGKNDPYNPFIKDELMRRLHHDTGQCALPGILVNLFVNGHHKSYYNLTAHGREKFLREYFRRPDSEWDVRQVADVADGDSAEYNAVMAFLKNTSFTSLANYLQAEERLDLDNYIDYLLVNAYGATGDWPHNNYIVARERAAGARWIFLLWDAEGAFGGFGKDVTWDTFQRDLVGTDQLSAVTHLTRVPYKALIVSPEFRLRVADRIQRLFFNGGALTDPAILARYVALRDEINPTVTAVRGAPISEAWFTSWHSQRRVVLFNTIFPGNGLWPATLGPVFSPHGGTLATGGQVSMSHPNNGGTIHYTQDGTDPREPGGAVAAGARTYAAPLTLTQAQRIRARVLRSGEWSPLVEAVFATVPPPLFISEIHYNPPGTSDATEFVELLNGGTEPVNLNGVRFIQGITFSFSGGVLGAGERLVLVRDAAAFSAAYPGVAVAGVFSGSLDNGGETLTLQDIAGNVITSITYDDAGLWPVSADGGGHSLVFRFPAGAANPDSPASWRASVGVGGKPGGSDALLFSGVPDADEDRDGVTALLEHALGTSDQNGNDGPGALTSQWSGDTPILRVRRRLEADDVELLLEASPDGQGWTSSFIEWLGDTGPTAGILTSRHAVRPPSPGRLLIRLRAVRR